MLARAEGTDLLPGGGNPSAGEGGIPASREVETPPSSELAAGLHKLMPDTIWDEAAIPILWNDCRRKAPECTAELILEQVSDKLKTKSWDRIRNPVGFLLTSVPPALQAALSASKWRAQARAKGELASAEQRAQRRLQHEQELAAWTMAEQAFEALPLERKQDLVKQERQRLLREHPEYRDRAHLPGWEQSFRSRAIKALVANNGPPACEFTLVPTEP